MAHAKRWIAHLDNRLAYERAMLAASGYEAPPKKKSEKASLPILNYPGLVAFRNPWHDGEILRADAVPLTKKQLAEIATDFKGTRISECGTHRIRIAMIRGHLYAPVYLTDSKIHERPCAEAVAAKATEEQSAIERRLEAAATKVPAVSGNVPAPNPDAATFDAMRQSLRAGVTTFVADHSSPRRCRSPASSPSSRTFFPATACSSPAPAPVT